VDEVLASCDVGRSVSRRCKMFVRSEGMRKNGDGLLLMILGVMYQEFSLERNLVEVWYLSSLSTTAQFCSKW
jgi:hypothetical protein